MEIFNQMDLGTIAAGGLIVATGVSGLKGIPPWPSLILAGIVLAFSGM